MGNVAQRARGEGIHDIENRHVDDHALRADFTDTLHNAAAQLYQVRVAERGLDRGYEVIPLFEDWDFHVDLPLYDRWRFRQRHDLIAQQTFGFLDSPLQVAYRCHFGEVHANIDQCLCNLRRQAGDND